MCNQTAESADNESNAATNHDNQMNEQRENDKNDNGDNDDCDRPANPLLSASLLSKAFFSWPYPLLQLGLKRPLEERDLPEIDRFDTSAACCSYFQDLWVKEQQRNPANPSLSRAIAKDFLTSLWYVQPLFALGAAAKISQAVALGYLIQSLENNGNDNNSDSNTYAEGYLWATVMFGSGVIQLFEHHHVFMMTWRKGMQMRIACVAAIYHKALRLSSTHHETAASNGKIMNLASNDVERFLLASLFINHVLWAPLTSLAVLYVGWTRLGLAFGAGFLLLVIGFCPLQFYLSRQFIRYRRQIAAYTDQRVNFVSQAVHGARVMKMSGFEDKFLHRIQQLRRQEVAQISKANRLKALNEALFFCVNVVISSVIFIVHVAVMGEALTSRDVFTTVTLVNILQLEINKRVSLGVMGVSEVFVSIQRIQKFLEFPELPSSTSSLPRKTDNSGADASPADHLTAMSLKNVSCYWNHVQQVRQQGEPVIDAAEKERQAEQHGLVSALTNITLDLPKAQLTCIVGPVGSGKSALLQALVGELPVHSGSLKRNYTTLAYAAQDPWIMDGTVKENILMGQVWDDECYARVVKSCGLDIDFQQLRDGDLTVVGTRGVQVSGGQRARIGMARALYQDTDVLVADDPLSAVDARVGRQLFQEAIVDLAVKRGKCVVLATHQHQHIGDHRCVLVMKGEIACIGTYKDCVDASNGKLSSHGHDDSIDELVDNGPADDDVVKTESLLEDDSKELMEVDASAKRQENREANVQGVVRFQTYLNYLQAMSGSMHGLLFGFFILALYSVTQASVLLTVAFMGKWAERSPSKQDSWDILGLMTGLPVLVVVLAVFRAIFSFEITVNASQRLHDRMANSVLRAKIEFFDTNPLGRILNRFSADVGSMDELLPETLSEFTVIAFIVVGAVITTLIVLPFTLIAFPPLVWYFLSVRQTFVTSTRELKRLEGLARSPVFSMLAESLGGIATIRANDSLSYFCKKFEHVHNTHTRAFFSFIACSRWAGFRLDGVMFLFLTLVTYLAVLFQQQGWFNIDPAVLGLSLSMLLQLAGMFQWCIRQNAEVVNLMVSVERVVAFGDLASEAPLEKPNDKRLLEQGWPSEGAVNVQNLSVRYRSTLPFALNGACFSIPGGARVGIVGRTGSGKSTFAQSLFRLLEAERGSICVDGVDISQLGLHALRTKISVIPQVPTLFSGCSVRENLDLFGTHSDAAIQKALEDAHLTSVIKDLPLGWDSMVSEGGSNFSVGQRQLLCLARAILNENKILVVDEATANVDRKLDEMLQEVLQESFKHGTIIAIAHRLESIIDYDLVLVLGHGKVLEFGEPADLIKRGGPFASMVQDTGESMAANLKQRAFQKQLQDTVGK